MTPNVGVSCNIEDVKYGGLWMERVAMVPLTYVRAVARAGGRPLLLAPTPADLADPDPLLDLLDGVLITGGADLAAETYGADAHPETVGTDLGSVKHFACPHQDRTHQRWVPTTAA